MFSIVDHMGTTSISVTATTSTANTSSPGEQNDRVMMFFATVYDIIVFVIVTACDSWCMVHTPLKRLDNEMFMAESV